MSANERKPVDVRAFFDRVRHVRDNAIRGAHADTVSNVSTETVQRACDRIAEHLTATEEVSAAVAELVEAANALRGKRGAIMALTQTDPRSVRFFAALARCGVQS